ncbi:MAG: carbohydrate ABC transporter permease [Opitutales bacterium]|nr:carbohydrate ABC transporter permease [Opitutales bacterium]
MKAAPLPPGKKKGREWIKHLLILIVLGLELVPFYMMMQISFKDNTTFIQNPWLPSWIGDWQWGNWIFGARLILPYVANTVFVAVTGTVASLFVALMAAYFFARYRMPLHGFLWSAFLILMLMPSVANIVPLFSLLKSMNLLNTLWALIIVGVAGGQVFNIYVLRNFIEDIPRDLFEAAEMDGASHFQQLIHIVIPMSGPILGTLAILSFLNMWNDFLLPLIVLRDEELFTIGVGLIYLDGEYVKQWGRIMAAFFIASIPLIILFLFTMKLFVRSLSSGAIKG